MSAQGRYSRQSEWISRHDQYKLSSSRILLAGCGAGSQVALSLARLGIGTRGKILVADPDTVTNSNLNRQAFFERHIGINKAIALVEHMQLINSKINAIAVPSGITLNTINELILGVDIVIEMVDIACPNIVFAIHQEAQKQKKKVVTGMDIGEGVINYVFDYQDDKAMTLQRFLGFSDSIQVDFDSLSPLALAMQYVIGPLKKVFRDRKESEQYYNTLLKNPTLWKQYLPPEMHEIINKLIKNFIGYIPQSTVAGTLLGVVQAEIIKEIILGHPVLIAPNKVKINLLSISNANIV